jgi:hypothetical protein
VTGLEPDWWLPTHAESGGGDGDRCAESKLRSDEENDDVADAKASSGDALAAAAAAATAAACDVTAAAPATAAVGSGKSSAPVADLGGPTITVPSASAAFATQRHRTAIDTGVATPARGGLSARPPKKRRAPPSGGAGAAVEAAASATSAETNVASAADATTRLDFEGGAVDATAPAPVGVVGACATAAAPDAAQPVAAAGGEPPEHEREQQSRIIAELAAQLQLLRAQMEAREAAGDAVEATGPVAEPVVAEPTQLAQPPQDCNESFMPTAELAQAELPAPAPVGAVDAPAASMAQGAVETELPPSVAPMLPPASATAADAAGTADGGHAVAGAAAASTDGGRTVFRFGDAACLPPPTPQMWAPVAPADEMDDSAPVPKPFEASFQAASEATSAVPEDASASVPAAPPKARWPSSRPPPRANALRPSGGLRPPNLRGGSAPFGPPQPQQLHRRPAAAAPSSSRRAAHEPHSAEHRAPQSTWEAMGVLAEQVRPPTGPPPPPSPPPPPPSPPPSNAAASQPQRPLVAPAMATAADAALSLSMASVASIGSAADGVESFLLQASVSSPAHGQLHPAIPQR